MSRRAALAGWISALALVTLAAPAPAVAGQMYDYRYYGDPGPNVVTATYNGASMVFADTAGLSVVRGSCIPVSATSVSCPYDPAYFVNLYAGNDSFTYTGGPPLPGTGNAVALFFVEGGAGADVLTGSPLSDDLRGDGLDENSDPTSDPAGNDQLIGGGGDDDLNDGDGASNRFEGGPGVDHVQAGVGTNAILGGPGDDFMGGGDGADTIDGDDGKDNINGLKGKDLVRGGAGDDSVEGGPGDDVADGGAGDDAVEASFHGSGCGALDTLIGGPGRDNLYAACGVPTFKMRDGARDEARCLPAIKTATIERDKIDEVTGGVCERRGSCGKKAKKGASAAGKKGKKCRKKGRRK